MRTSFLNTLTLSQKSKKLLDKISPETELSIPSPSSKNRPTLVSIPHIQNNPSTHSLSPSLSYKSLFLLPTLGSKSP